MDILSLFDWKPIFNVYINLEKQYFKIYFFISYKEKKFYGALNDRTSNNFRY